MLKSNIRVHCLWLLICLSLPYLLHAQSSAQTSITTTQTAAAEEPLRLIFINDMNLLLYFHHNQIVEITGNERTFTAAFNLAFTSIRIVSPSWRIRFRSDVVLIEPLSLKGRLYENFTPPPLLFSELALNIQYIADASTRAALAKQNFQTAFTFGIFRPLVKVFPMKSYFYPIVFKTSPYDTTTGLDAASPTRKDLREIGHSFVTGHRDEPLGAIVVDRFDTGILYSLLVRNFAWALGVSNGEEGLDANSAKTISTRFAFSNAKWHTGVNMQVGNIGSVPIKETKHYYQLFFYWNSADFPSSIAQEELEVAKLLKKPAKPKSSVKALQYRTGFESMLHLHGVRQPEILNADGTIKENYTYQGYDFDTIDELFDFMDGYFSPFTVFNNGSYDDSSQISHDVLYGLSYLLYLELRYKKFLSFTTHFSGYDPNLLSESYEPYLRRYRGFVRFGFHLKNYLSFYFSATYTHDVLHLNWDQFYEREPRDPHFIRDYSLYAGLVYYIAR